MERLALVLLGSVLEVDVEGRVWRISRHGKPCARHRAEYRGGVYLRVPATVPGVGYRPLLAHRLVFEVRRGGIPDGHIVYPLDGNWWNTHPSNLATKPGKARRPVSVEPSEEKERASRDSD